MRSLFADLPDPQPDRRRLPAQIRQAFLALKAEYPAFGPREIATICQERFDRPAQVTPRQRRGRIRKAARSGRA
jgi:hypothetical protein